MINDKGEWEPDPPSLEFCKYCGKVYVMNAPSKHDKPWNELVIDLSEALKTVTESVCQSPTCQLRWNN